MLLVAPTIIGLVILNIIPIFQTIYMSFFEVGAFGRDLSFVGFDNYIRLFQDEQIRQATWNTFKYTLMYVPPTIIISLLLAVLLNQKIAGRGIYRTIYFLPMVAAPAAVTMVWRWLYNKDFGLINYLLNKIGIESIAWIEDPKIALYSIVIIGIWSQIGYCMVLFLSGLQEIPKVTTPYSNQFDSLLLLLVYGVKLVTVWCCFFLDYKKFPKIIMKLLISMAHHGGAN